VYKGHICPCEVKDKSYSNKDVRKKAKSVIRQLKIIRFGLRLIIYEVLSLRN
jgi:hypothetical protein